MKNRSVTHLLYAHERDMGGIPIRQPFPTVNLEQIDPFLLLHHTDIKVPELRKPFHGGVGPHPHRGFSPVTFIFKGGVHHRDSRGNDSVVYAGGAQWMNAGMGVIHSERPPADIKEHGGRQEIVQLWVNTPARFKMQQPAYYAVHDEQVPRFLSEDKLVTVRVFAGEILGVRGPVPTLTPVNAATIHASAGGRIRIPVPTEFSAFLYLLNGKVKLDGYGLVEGLNAVRFAHDGDQIGFEALEDTRMLLMSGLPLNEEVVSQGPFVMNNTTEILEAMRDYQMGKMGVLIEE